VVLLLVVALVARVFPVGVAVLVERVELLPLGAVGDEVGDVAALEASHIVTILTRRLNLIRVLIGIA
jgi:hypothetical protein